MRLAALFLALGIAATAGAQTYPPEDPGGGGGISPSDYPLLGPCGTIGAPSYSFNGAGTGEMGMWCTAPDATGTLVIQNRYDNAGATQPNLEGRSRLSLGLEFWSLNAVRVEDNDFMSIQGFDEGGGVPKVRIDVTDDAVTGSYSFFEDRMESTEQIRGQVQSACTIGAISFGFVGDTDTGMCSDTANQVEIFAGAGEKARFSGTQVQFTEGDFNNTTTLSLQGFFPSIAMTAFKDSTDTTYGLQFLGSQDEGRLFAQDHTTGDQAMLAWNLDYWDFGFDEDLPFAAKSAFRLDFVSSTSTTATLGEDVTLIFEGATDDANETTLTVEDPLADNTVTIPDHSGRPWLTGTTVMILEEEFCNGGDSSRRIGMLGWSVFNGSAIEAVGVANHPCILTNDSDGGSGDRSAVYLGNSTGNGHLVATDMRRLTYIFQVDSLTDTIVQVGLFNDADTANITEGLYLEFDPAADAEFNGVTELADTRTAAATTVTVAAATWYNATMIQLANGNWEFYVGTAGATPALEVTNSTNLPTAALIPAFRVTKTTAADKSMTVDYWSAESEPLTR